MDKPFLLFGSLTNAALGGYRDYQDCFGSADEAAASAATRGLVWFQIAVYQHDGVYLVGESYTQVEIERDESGKIANLKRT